jgi:hypothetical protein
MAPPNTFFFRGIYGLDCKSCDDCSDFLAVDDGTGEVTPQTSCGCCHHALSEHRPPPPDQSSTPNDGTSAALVTPSGIKMEESDTLETAPVEVRVASVPPANLNDAMNAEAGILQEDDKKRPASNHINGDFIQMDDDEDTSVAEQPGLQVIVAGAADVVHTVEAGIPEATELTDEEERYLRIVKVKGGPYLILQALHISGMECMTKDQIGAVVEANSNLKMEFHHPSLNSHGFGDWHPNIRTLEKHSLVRRNKRQKCKENGVDVVRDTFYLSPEGKLFITRLLARPDLAVDPPPPAARAKKRPGADVRGFFEPRPRA